LTVHPIIFELYRKKLIGKTIENQMSIPGISRGDEKGGGIKIMKMPCLTKKLFMISAFS
jgi:hypothetical protein